MADLNRIQFKRTSTKGRRPDAGTMNPGELAINLADQYLLTKNDSGAIINLSCPPVYDRDVTMAGKVKGNNYILSKTANYLDDQTARDLNYFGAFRTNGLDGFLELTLNVPHSSGVRHGRGFTFQYGHNGSRVETYGYNKEGQKAFSYKMYHEGDKPTPGELNVYSKQEIDRMFIKNVKMSVPSGDATRGYFKIATAMIPQNGRMAFLRIYGGNGYNVNSYDQVDFLEIVIRGGNNNPKGVSIAAYRRNSLNVHEVFAINTSGDNYDIYVNYGRYTNNVIVEFGKTVDVALTVHDVPEFSATKPATGTKFDARVITMFNTENKAGTLMFDNNGQGTYDIISLNNSTDSNKKYLRKFRSKSAETIWHEVVEGSVYRLATGVTDQSDQLKIDFNGVTVNRLFVKGNNAIRMERRDGQSNYLEFYDYRSGANRRQGYLGYGDGTTNTVQLVNELTEGTNSLRLDDTGQVTLSVGKTKIVYTNGQYYSANSDAYRMIYGNYGAFWRNDGTKVYLLSTEENDRFGGWNGNRPFIYDLTTGKVTLGGDGNEGALVLERDSRAARFAGDIYVGNGMLTFDAGRLNSRDYFRFNHWGDSNNARDNILQLDDSKGAHFTTERTLATGAIKTKFFGDLESAGQIKWGKGTATSTFNIRVWGDDARKQVFECGDESGWHWYTQRAGGPGTYAIDFSINGTVRPQTMDCGGNITLRGADIEFKRSGNKHLWFRDPNGLELGLIYCDDAGAIRVRGEKSTEVWKFSAKQIHLETGTAGNGVGLLRGAVGGGAWTQWRDRGTGLQVDCQQSENSAHNVWRATHQGKYHIAAMGVHVPGGTIGNAMVRMHVHNATFDFSATGDFQAVRNGNFNDVYIRSDARLKINKEEYKENATDKVNRLTVYTYDKVKSLTDRTVIAHEVGIIAQDLEKELPEAVTTSKIGDGDTPEEILTISNSAVNALLIKAFQEMSEELKAVKAELAELKKN